MLGMGNLMVGILHFYPHGFKGENSIPAKVFGSIQRVVKITTFIEGVCTPVGFKIEILELRTKIKGKPLLFCFLKVQLEDISGISFIGRAIRFEDIAEHARNSFFFWPPRKDCKGDWIWPCNHVTLVNSCKALDGRSVKAHS